VDSPGVVVQEIFPMIAIINYGMGNLSSVKRKLDRIGEKSIITSNQEEIKNSNRIILPGVGHFSKAVSEIKERGLWDLLSEQVLVEKKPILGICLGMQLMAKQSEEGDSEGFGWFDANVIRFRVSDTIRFKIPHIGWNSVTIEKHSLLFENSLLNSEFYFVHSYHVQCKNSEDILAETIYDYPFTSAIQKKNIVGVQFHPEKSHDAGENLFRNFLKY
jgi:imidazole glycerol-phosphate synthase subunit HisH